MSVLTSHSAIDAAAIIHLPWPVDEFSADPNDHYRPWIEANVGEQGIDWQWKLVVDEYGDRVRIQFTKKAEKWAIITALRFG